MDVISSCLTNGLNEQASVDQMKEVMGYQAMDMPNDMLVKEGLQHAAYGDQELGVSHFGTQEGLQGLSPASLNKYRDLFLTQNNMVLCAAGMEHDRLVEYADKFFGHLPVSNSERPKMVRSEYRGGEYRLEKADVTGLTRVAVAFEIGGWHSEDLVANCVLQILLGGGDSFSAGGPGKGMYSRLYREVLNRYYWVEGAEAFTSMHEESGLLGISGASSPAKAQDMVVVLLEQFAKLACVPVTDEELSRARNMLRCNVLTQLESR